MRARPALMALWGGLLAALPAQAVPVRFRVEVPHCTPLGGQVMLRSNRLAAGVVQHDPLSKVDANHYEASLDVAIPPAQLAYRYSLGVCDATACPGIEKAITYDGSGFDLPDRTLPPGASSVDDLVYVWRSNLLHLDAQGAPIGLRSDAEKVAFCAPYLSVDTVEGSLAIGFDAVDAGMVRLDYGRTPALGQTLANTGDYRNFFPLGELTPGARYYYRLSEDGQVRHEGSFDAPPAPGAPFRFAFIGDTQYYGEQQRLDTSAIVDQILAFDPQLVLSPGDMVASERGPSAWIPPEMGRFSVFFAQLAPLMAKAPFMAAMGNHEEDAGYYWSVFNFPKPDLPRIDHYYFKYGSVLFIGLYTGVTEGYNQDGILDSQTLWLQSVLETAALDTSIRWKVVYLHRGPFSQGANHPTDGQSFYANSNGSRPSWGQVWESQGVNLVLAGHNHNLTVSENAGVRYVTSCGGAPPHDLRTPNDATTLYAERSCSADLFTVGLKTLAFAAQRPDGSPIPEAAFALCKADSDCNELANPCPENVRWSCNQVCQSSCVPNVEITIPDAPTPIVSRPLAELPAAPDAGGTMIGPPADGGTSNEPEVPADCACNASATGHGTRWALLFVLLLGLGRWKAR